MKVATAPVNWNSPHVPDYRPATPYPQLLEEMKAAGYTATEWSTDMPKDPAILAADLQGRKLRLLGGYVELELRTDAKRDHEISKGVEIGKFFSIAWRRFFDRSRWRSPAENSRSRSC
jgi:hypothetical protein